MLFGFSGFYPSTPVCFPLKLTQSLWDHSKQASAELIVAWRDVGGCEQTCHSGKSKSVRNMF